MSAVTVTMLGEVFVQTAAAATGLLWEPVLEQRWDTPSALDQFQVSGLAGHLAWQVLAVPGRLAAPTPHGPPVTLLDYYTTAAWVGAPLDGELNAGLRDLGEQTAKAGPVALAGQVDVALAELRALLPHTDGTRLVAMRTSAPPLTVDDLLATRILEIAVHADDLAVSLGVRTPSLPEAATDLVIGLLARVATRRHGPVPLLRALSRAERAPATIAAL
ncbi:maleylpyruvate isomerase N-terminal domain-containing protein [Frankia sp. R82]|uniref:maleylpyruvate isomerase N-terminal domain-containing protein n=1 Tax=Frankia sp. R82 TaxID=2950553 RepID=UPI00204331AA|nr:maleylpyruvate isomerase N-terminal domain-containing protein [Frankia sp. R82]MCM3887179.1 maleylpyruvate isomerase N-terminal domain-containing protein [Frankia sp. R82]